MRDQNYLNKLSKVFQNVLNLFYPNLCLLCEQRTHSSDEIYCLDCQFHVFPTGMYDLEANEFTNHFKGRLDLNHGSALYYYVKGGRLQKAIESLKYKNRPDIGLQLGRLLGSFIKDSSFYADSDMIVPVPLHPKRKIQRGYNQSYLIACGISEYLHIPIEEGVIRRKTETITQTEKNRAQRGINMIKVFELVKPEFVHGKHILLVDDILTTGATLEACAKCIQTAGLVRISMLTIAMAT